MNLEKLKKNLLNCSKKLSNFWKPLKLKNLTWQLKISNLQMKKGNVRVLLLTNNGSSTSASVNMELLAMRSEPMTSIVRQTCRKTTMTGRLNPRTTIFPMQIKANLHVRSSVWKKGYLRLRYTTSMMFSSYCTTSSQIIKCMMTDSYTNRISLLKTLKCAQTHKLKAVNTT